MQAKELELELEPVRLDGQKYGAWSMEHGTWNIAWSMEYGGEMGSISSPIVFPLAEGCPDQDRLRNDVRLH